MPRDAKRATAMAGAMTADFALTPGLTRTARVVGPDGRPLTGAFVWGFQPLGGRHDALAGDRFTLYGLDPDRPRRVYVEYTTKALAALSRERVLLDQERIRIDIFLRDNLP